MAWELDGLRIRVTVPQTEDTATDPLPVAFGWASAVAKRVSGTQVITGIATPSELSVLCIWPPDALEAGGWRIQVRAGTSEATARTLFDAEVTIQRSLRPT
jgi:hypothetical protein